MLRKKDKRHLIVRIDTHLKGNKCVKEAYHAMWYPLLGSPLILSATPVVARLSATALPLPWPLFMLSWRLTG